VALYFLDTSALAKLYIREEGTDSMLALTKVGQGNEFALLSIGTVEFRSALRRRQRAGDVDEPTASEILALFASHREERFIVQPLTETVIDGATDLVDRHFLRAYDAIQLSGCLTLASNRSGCIFTCSDEDLLKAARSEGLLTFDPAAQKTST
jgi:uncharacterized protein